VGDRLLLINFVGASALPDSGDKSACQTYLNTSNLLPVCTCALISRFQKAQTHYDGIDGLSRHSLTSVPLRCGEEIFNCRLMLTNQEGRKCIDLDVELNAESDMFVDLLGICLAGTDRSDLPLLRICAQSNDVWFSSFCYFDDSSPLGKALENGDPIHFLVAVLKCSPAPEGYVHVLSLCDGADMSILDDVERWGHALRADNWKIRWDQDWRAPFFWHPETGESSWDIPRTV